MKRKSYLRGAGLALIVASLVTAFGTKSTMSNEQIMAKAKELGMVEGNSYLSSTKESASEEEPIAMDEPEDAFMSATEPIESTPESVEPEEEVLPEEITSEEFDETVALEPSEKPDAELAKDTEEEQPNEEKITETPVEIPAVEIVELPAEETVTTTDETVEFQIRGGDSSDRVSRRLAEVGLVGDAQAFDKFLCQNGYDKKIRVGHYEIPVDSSDEMIARMITGAWN